MYRTRFWGRVHRIFRPGKNALTRARLTLFASLIFNVSYSALLLAFGIYYRTNWLLALAVYYLLLILMRLLLLRDLKSLDPQANENGVRRRYLHCGIALVTMTPALLALVLFILFDFRKTDFHSATTVISTTYTLILFTLAAVNLIKERKASAPLIKAARVLSLITASVSFLSVQTALCSSLLPPKHFFLGRILVGTSGALICIFVLGAGIYMITRYKKETKI